MKVSVLTPTKYPERLKVVRDALGQQSLSDFEWLICSKDNPGIPEAGWIPDTFEGGFWSLNRAYNALFEASNGDILVSLQDNIWISPDGISKFVFAIEKTGGVVSGVGDQYSRVGEYGKPEVKVWNDSRKTDKYGNFYECIWNDCEFNWAAFPREIVFEAGGMDEKLDFLGYGGDQLQLCERWNDSGKKFFLDQTNESFTLRHGRVDGWDENHVLRNGAYDKRKSELKRSGEWRRLPYLGNRVQ